MERLPPPIGENKHQYQSAQLSRLLHRKYLADAPPNRLFPIITNSSRSLPQLKILPSRSSSHLLNSRQQVYFNHYNQPKNTNQITHLLSSPLPPLLSTHYIHAVLDPISSLSKSSIRRFEKESLREGHGKKGSPSFKTGERLLIAEMEMAAKIPKMELGMPNPPHKQTMRIRTSHPELSINQQSNSVPSTPHQHLRKYSLESREQSPGATNGHSPRSAFSESNILLPSARFGSRPGGCCYETGLANAKRRMPYSIGSENLEKMDPTKIKSSLSEEEERKLSSDMDELYRKLLPSPECELRRAKLVSKLQKLFSDKWPGHNILVHVFGSSGNCLYTDHSDVDLCITTDKKEMEGVCIIADLLAKSGMEKVICVSTAKVPIVKIWDPELCLACDMNVNNTLALENTRMIKTYVQIDERVRPLAMIIKYWTKRRIVNDAAFGGTLSSYTWICMIINFLQSRNPPILPALHQRASVKQSSKNKEGNSFADDIETLRNFGYKNKETLGELLFSFFRFYSHEFDYDTLAVSVRLGKQISKVEKGWHLTTNNKLCVEEPFNISRNLGNTADDTSFRGLHIELRRAFDLISQAKLQECCEQWNFPPEEERKIWEPATRAKVVLRSASTSRGGRGGTQRANRHSNQQYRQNSGNNRRASSGTYEVNSFLPGPQQQNILTRESWLQRQVSQAQLSNEIYSTFPALQVHESNFRFHLYANGLHVQAFTQPQAQSQTPSTRMMKPNASESSRTSSFEQPSPFATPMRPDIYYFPTQYPANSVYKYQNTTKHSHSASLSAAMSDIGQSVHHSTTANVPRHTEPSTNCSLRSNSQPAARASQQLFPHGIRPSASGLNSDQGYLYQENSMPTPKFGTNDISDTMHLSANNPVERPTPMEYVGYYVREKFPGSIPRGTEVPIMIPTFGDISQQKRHYSTEKMTQSIQNSYKHTSRSSSPLSNGRVDPVAFRSTLMTGSPALRSIPNSKLMAISPPISPVAGNLTPMPEPIPSWQAHVNEASIYDEFSQESKIGSGDANRHKSFISNELIKDLRLSERKISNEADTSISNEQNNILNGSAAAHINGNSNGNIEVNPNSSSSFKTLVPVLNKTLNHQTSLEALNGYHNHSPDNSRSKPSSSSRNGIAMPSDFRDYSLRDDLPTLSPVFELQSKSSEGNQISNTHLDRKEKNTINPRLGDKKTTTFNQGRSSVASNSNLSSISKRHNQGSKSEGDGHGSWQQASRGRKKNSASISKGFACGRDQSEKLPKNVSERKGG